MCYNILFNSTINTSVQYFKAKNIYYMYISMLFYVLIHIANNANKTINIPNRSQ